VVEEAGLSGSPLPLRLAISDGSCGLFSSATVPRLTYANRVHPLLRFRPLQSAALLGPPRIRKLEAPSLGFAVPLRDICPPRPCPEPSQLLGALPPSTFLTSSTVYSAIGFVGLFHPTATSRVHSSGVSSSSAAAPSFDDRCPLVVGSTRLKAVAHLRHLVELRPQGFALRPNPDSLWPGVSRPPSPIPS
jgi:hypothetical protein